MEKPAARSQLCAGLLGVEWIGGKALSWRHLSLQVGAWAWVAAAAAAASQCGGGGADWAGGQVTHLRGWTGKKRLAASLAAAAELHQGSRSVRTTQVEPAARSKPPSSCNAAPEKQKAHHPGSRGRR